MDGPTYDRLVAMIPHQPCSQLAEAGAELRRMVRPSDFAPGEETMQQRRHYGLLSLRALEWRCRCRGAEQIVTAGGEAAG